MIQVFKCRFRKRYVSYRTILMPQRPFLITFNVSSSKNNKRILLLYFYKCFLIVLERDKKQICSKFYENDGFQLRILTKSPYLFLDNKLRINNFICKYISKHFVALSGDYHDGYFFYSCTHNSLATAWVQNFQYNQLRQILH